MASVHYDGEKVGIGVEKVRSIAEDLETYSNNIYEATKTIVCSNGFDFYVGGITANTFSDAIQTFSSGVNDLIHGIREEQIKILQYSQNKDDIKVFLKSLTDEEQKMYDLEEIERLKDRSSNIFKRAGSTIAAAGLGLLEGIGDFFETGADLIVMAGCGVASIFTAGLDFFTGKHGDDSVTKRLWDWCKGYVADKKVETCFNKFYSNTEVGRQIKANAYHFDTIRSVSKGIGYTAGMIGLTVLTGGLAAGGGAAIGAAGTVTSTNLALTAGVLGFSNGTEEAWADGADLLDGFKYGLASGAWEGTQWYLGAKINQFGGVGDQVAKTFFNGAKGAATRVALDTVDSAAEGFVQPALKMLYKYDDSKSWSENYKQQFEEAGGWDNVKTQAIMGGAMSAISETGNLRKLLKENDSGAALEGDIVGGTAAATGTVATLDNSKISAIGKTTASMNGKNIDVDILPANAKLDTSRMKIIDADIIKNTDAKVSAKNVDISNVNDIRAMSVKTTNVNLKNVDTGSIIKNADVSAKSLSAVNPKVIEGEVVTKNVGASSPVKYTKAVTSNSSVIKNVDTTPVVKNVDTTPAVKNTSSLPVVKEKRTISGVSSTSSVPSVYTRNADTGPIVHTRESVRETVKDGIESSITSGVKGVDSSLLIDDFTDAISNSGDNSNSSPLQRIINTGQRQTVSAAGVSLNRINNNANISSKSLATSISNKNIISSKNITDSLGTVGVAGSLIPAVNLKSIDTNIDGNIAKNITSSMDNNLSKNVSVKGIGGNVDLDINTKGVSLKNTNLDINTKNISTDVNLKNVDSNISTKNVDANIKNTDVKVKDVADSSVERVVVIKDGPGAKEFYDNNIRRVTDGELDIDSEVNIKNVEVNNKPEVEIGKSSDINVEKTSKSRFADPELYEPKTKISEVAVEEKSTLDVSGGKKSRFADPELYEPKTKISEVAVEEKSTLDVSGGKKNRFADPSLYESDNKISNMVSTDVSKNVDSNISTKNVDANIKNTDVKVKDVADSSVERVVVIKDGPGAKEFYDNNIRRVTDGELDVDSEINIKNVEVNNKPEVEVRKPELDVNDKVDVSISSSGIGGKSGANQKVEMAEMYRKAYPEATDIQIKERIDGIFDGSIAMNKNDAHIIQDFISRYSTDDLEARKIFNDNFAKNSDGTYSYRTSSTPSYNAPSYTSKHFDNYDDLISNVDDPLSTENVKKIVELFDDKSTAGYDDIVSLNSKGAKLEPDVSVERDFLNKFTEDNGYRIHKQHEYFLHVIDENNYDYDVTTRIYLNVSDYTDAYKFGMEFADECSNEGMGFYFKTGRTENGKFMSDFTKNRDEAIVIYCSQDQVANYTNIVNKVLKKTGIELDDPPILTGRVAGTNIGIGAEPTMLDERASFNGVRTKAIQDAYKYTKATYNERAIIKNSPEYYEYFKKVLADRGKKWYIDPNNFALEKAA